MNRPDIEAIRQRADAAMPGPWFWRGNVDVHLRLASRAGRGGEHTVMDFVRAGMQEAVPRFNRNGFMYRADGRHRGGEDMPIFEVCPEATDRKHPRVYRGDIIGLRHPDAEFMACARQDIDDLLAYIAELEARP
ncbi:MAG: hypothetical protein AB7R89_13820 [Dehalococcoidia bacterium]